MNNLIINLNCLGYFKKKGVLFKLELILKKGNGKIFYKNLINENILRNIFYIYKFLEEFFSEKFNIIYDLYLNIIPENFKKTGNSITLPILFAILCGFLRVKIKNFIAITGFLDFNFNILPVFNLKEKFEIALHNNIYLIIIPKKNISDLKNISIKILSKLIILKVDNIFDIIDLINNRIIGI